MKKLFLVSCFLFSFCFAGLFVQEAVSAEKVISLPPAQKSGGMPLMEALSLRKSERTMSDKELSMQEISNLLWAAWGINRPDGRRTLPTANNSQNLDIYIVLKSGVWLYDAQKNALVLKLDKDVRSTYSPAGATLLYAVPVKDTYGGIHIGAAAQNAGLFCASQGLANVVKASGSNALKSALPLQPGYAVFLIQNIGYRK